MLVRVKVVALQPGEQWVAGPEQPPLASSIKFSVSWRSWALESALFRFPCARQRPWALALSLALPLAVAADPT